MRDTPIFAVHLMGEPNTLLIFTKIMTAIFEFMCYLNIASISEPCRVRHTHHGAHGAPYVI